MSTNTQNDSVQEFELLPVIENETDVSKECLEELINGRGDDELELTGEPEIAGISLIAGTPQYTNSSLVTYTQISPNKNESRVHSTYNPTGKILKITPHHMAGNCTIEVCGNIFAPTSRGASSNYGIGSDGRIGMYVEEKSRAWTSSSAANDYVAVTIEIANDGGASSNWHVSDKAIESAINLITDICKRNGIAKLTWTGNKDGNVTCHDMFIATCCPGPYLKSKFPYIVEKVNANLTGKKEEDTKPAPKPSEPITPSTSKYTAGDSYYLNNVNLYSSASATRRSNTVTGIYYIWSSDVINSKIRITNAKNRVGVDGQVTGFVNVSDLTTKEQPATPKPSNPTPTPKPSTPTTTTFKAGDLVKITGTKYYDGQVIPDWVKAQEWYVDSVSGNRVVINKNKSGSNAIMSAVNASDLKLVSGAQSTTTSSTSFKQGDKVKFKSTATKWAENGGFIPAWVKSSTLYIRSDLRNGNSYVVSTLASGAITGVAYASDLMKA